MFTLTLDWLRMVSFKLSPVRMLSLCCVVQLTCAFAEPTKNARNNPAAQTAIAFLYRMLLLVFASGEAVRIKNTR